MSHLPNPGFTAAIIAFLIWPTMVTGAAEATDLAARQGTRDSLDHPAGVDESDASAAATGSPPAADRQLAGVPNERIDVMFREANRLEEEGEFMTSSRILEDIVNLTRGDPRPYWRIARNYIGLAESLPITDEAERNEYFTLAEQWADRGLEVDPQCGECCLYKVGGLGGRLRKGGILGAASEAPRIARLLEKGIALLREYPDHDVNPELQELYYAAAQFYRAVPEWPWLKWVLGVQGSRRRAVEYMRKASEIATNISGPRPDYLVELGASLLCLGEADGEPELAAQGLDVLQTAMLLGQEDPAASVDVQHAGILIADPGEACDYSRYDWIHGQLPGSSTADPRATSLP